MLCPVPTNGETGTMSKWLDRLRSSRGLPAADDTLALDHYLNSNDDRQSSPTTDESTQSNDSRPEDRSPPPPQWLGIQLILSDLFNVSDTRGDPGRRRSKGARKQPNPRCYQADDRSSGCPRKENEAELASPASLNCSGDEDDDDDDDDDDEGMERGRGYSRSEVTVIDTSCQGWKFDKVVYRRKDVWKVRDKKGRTCWSGMKRKRLDSTENGNGDSGMKKGNVGAAKYNVQDRQEEKTEENCKEPLSDNCQVYESRSHLSRSSVQLKKTGSSTTIVNYGHGNTNKGKKLYKNLMKGGGQGA